MRLGPDNKSFGEHAIIGLETSHPETTPELDESYKSDVVLMNQ